MPTIVLIEWVVTAIFCVAASLAAVAWLNPRQKRQDTAEPVRTDDLIWVFDGTDLADTNDIADITTWQDLRHEFIEQFPGFPDTPEQVLDQGRCLLRSTDANRPETLLFETDNQLVQATLSQPPVPRAPAADRDRNDTAILLATIEQTPYPIWRIDRRGAVIWTNRAYDRLACALCLSTNEPDAAALPERANLFPGIVDVAAGESKRRFVTDTRNDDRRLWFDVTVVPNGDTTLCFATDVNAVVEAEDARRNFVQTLAKTFAHLPIGLAIFDRTRQLALFNPALIELSGLPVDFLSARPNLLTMFDRMRDLRMFPEPKNYTTWRQQMAELMAAASDGNYQETWTLPSGAVYSVSGRPHPDGAIAFLIEDITAEITLTRRFRADLELSQCVLDQLDTAVAVFTADCTLTMTNAAYRSLWSTDPEHGFDQTSVIEATRCWQNQCKATPLWGEIRDFVASRENRAEWRGEIRLLSGDPLICDVVPIRKGATMVRFTRTGPSLTAATRPGATLLAIS